MITKLNKKIETEKERHTVRMSSCSFNSNYCLRNKNNREEEHRKQE